MDKQIRIPQESHVALKKYAKEHHITIRQAAEVAINALHLSIVVAVNEDGSHDIVEPYTRGDLARDRADELAESGFARSQISRAHRAAMDELQPLRKYGPEWKEAVGWTL